MDKTDLVRRTQKAAWRSAGKTPVSTQRAWYNDDMAKLGRMRKAASEPKHADDRIEGWGDFLTHPVSIIIIAIITFALILSVMLWRDGKFDQWLDRLPERGSTSWMRGNAGEAPVIIDEPDQVIEGSEPNEMERVLEEQRAEAEAKRAAAIAAAANPEPFLTEE